jgi:hypothetical protein
MKISLPARAALWKHPEKGDCVLLKATCKKDHDLFLRFFRAKTGREQRDQKEYIVQAALDLPLQKRTFKQNAAVWKLVTVIFESMEGRLPSDEEKHGLYLDLLDTYAGKVPNRINGGLRPVHISEADSLEGSKFIDGLLYHLATACDLSYGAQTTVREVLYEWEAWRGGMEADHADYTDDGQAALLTEAQWRGKRAYSEASGRGGGIVRAHIVSRGSDAADIEKAWNWMALTPDEHAEQHRLGWEGFLQIYPHLRGRVDRARRLAGKLSLECGGGRRGAGRKPERLALEALGEA